MRNFAHSAIRAKCPTGLKENSCGGLTGKNMNVPEVNIKQLLEAGVHLGHKTLRWNPKMKKYIFGEKNSIHIIDLTQTVSILKSALEQKFINVFQAVEKILIVSTKKQASEQVSSLAKETDQFYVNYRWLGGMLTNWNTIQNSIKRMQYLKQDLSKEDTGFTKKEILKFGKKEINYKDLRWNSRNEKNPQMIFIIDTNIESLAVKEAIKLNIPIVAILDTNSDPTDIQFPIPGNDDARRSINLYCDLLKDTIIDAAKLIEIKEVPKEAS